MKLYSETTSERASKGQGGNHHILTVLTAEIDGERQEIVSMSVVISKNDVIGDYYNVEIITPTNQVIKEQLAVKTKGKKQKGELCNCGMNPGFHVKQHNCK